MYSAWGDHTPRYTLRARVKRACCTSSLERASAVARLRARHAKAGCVLGSQQARRTTVLRQRRGGYRRCIALSWGAGRPQPARQGARATQARVLHLLARESERSGALACVPRKSRLCVGGRSGHVAPRSCVEGDRPLADAVPFYKVRTDHSHGTARTRGKRACASSQQRASTVARLRTRHARAFCVLEASAGTSQHDLTPKDRGRSQARWPCVVHVTTIARAARCARA